jgi:hypothetical protein
MARKKKHASPMSIPLGDTETMTRSVMLQVRMTVLDRITLRIASRTMKQSMSDFVRSVALQAAEAIIQTTGGTAELQSYQEKSDVQTRKAYAPRKVK